MADPLSDVISLLRPQAPASKLVETSDPFRVRRDSVSEAFYCLQLSGRARLEVNGQPAQLLTKGDFVLIPSVTSFTISSMIPPPLGVRTPPVVGADGVVRIGPVDGPVEGQQLIGHCRFGNPDAELLLTLLPELIVVHSDNRLEALANLVRDEARAQRPARDVVLENLLQVLLIEAFRTTSQRQATPGLLRGLADDRIGPTLRAIHADPQENWSVSQLSQVAGLSRSALFTRFNRIVGLPPMSYLLNWRMTLAKHMLRSEQLSIGQISTRIGYGSVSAFSTAFTRHVGSAPRRYAKRVANA